ncbi:hypothetical protein Q8F55_006300 [Vanrija albida]|uniref:SnoaL-like domain-containing protein n=1 Tax=Vanrija albida TaxID=181172 RepID=A0ABR3PWU1_9TREE
MPPTPTPPPPLASSSALEAHYAAYLSMLNDRAFDPPTFGTFVSPTVVHNDRALGHPGYQGLISPGAVFTAKSASADVPAKTAPGKVTANLHITVPGPGPDGGVFDEWVRYWFDEEGRIERVESVVERVGEAEGV